MSVQDTYSRPISTGEPTSQQSPQVDILGAYQATLEFRSQRGQAIHGKVTVEGSALVVEQVITAAADAFREDTER